MTTRNLLSHAQKILTNSLQVESCFLLVVESEGLAGEKVTISLEVVKVSLSSGSEDPLAWVWESDSKKINGAGEYTKKIFQD